MLGSLALLAALSCPHGNVQFVSSPALADYTVRFVGSRAAADCVIKWASIAPGRGEWREVDSFPDFRVFATEGIADFTAFTWQ